MASFSFTLARELARDVLPVEPYVRLQVVGDPKHHLDQRPAVVGPERLGQQGRRRGPPAGIEVEEVGHVAQVVA